MKRLLLIAAIAFQILSVAAIALSREWILINGQTLTFQTAPIDPRDLFRGDYVHLNYLFSSVSLPMLDERIVAKGLKEGAKVYLGLETGPNGISEAPVSP